jgi:hypothetical protein
MPIFIQKICNRFIKARKEKEAVDLDKDKIAELYALQCLKEGETSNFFASIVNLMLIM